MNTQVCKCNDRGGCAHCGASYHPVRRDENGAYGLYFLCPECQVRFVAAGGTLEELLGPEMFAYFMAPCQENEDRFAAEQRTQAPPSPRSRRSAQSEQGAGKKYQQLLFDEL
jgi:hypothetical protein